MIVECLMVHRENVYNVNLINFKKIVFYLDQH